MKSFINKLFGRKQEESKADSQKTTAPLDEKQLQMAVFNGSMKIEPPQLVVGCARSMGIQRDHNEDAIFTFTANIGVDSTTMPFGVYIVADGMGGHQYGEVASEIAVRTMSNHLLDKLYRPIFGPDRISPTDSVNDILADGIKLANSIIAEKAPGGGTTITCVVVLGNRMTIAHVGDSRAYAVYLDGRMQVLTRDHSLVKRLQEMGQISAEEAEVHPQKNVLYRALGQAEPFDPDVSTTPIPQPGYVLICSDGLWGLVSDQDMFQIISEAPNPHRACQSLVEAANAAGGHDNITTILVRMPE